MTVDIAQGNAHGIASIYNSAVAAWAIAAAWEVGALDELHRARTLDTADFAARAGLDPQSTTGLFRALASVGLVRRDGAVVYTLDGMRPLLSASEWAALARKHIPGAEIVFSPDPVIVEFLRFYDCPIDDSNARKEWGWSPAYDTEALVVDFLEELRLHREMYE